jgi:PHAX RNA-binding domain
VVVPSLPLWKGLGSGTGPIKRIVQTIGDERVLAILQQALELEQHGGLMLADGKRRTPGGVFFRLVKEQMSPEECRQVWFYQARTKAAQQTEQQTTD